MSEPLTMQEREALRGCSVRGYSHRLLADLERVERERDEALAAMSSDGADACMDNAVLRTSLAKAERERDEARDYAAQIATGVSHYPHSEGEPCIRCERDGLRNRLNTDSQVFEIECLRARVEMAERQRDEARETEAHLRHAQDEVVMLRGRLVRVVGWLRDPSSHTEDCPIRALNLAPYMSRTQCLCHVDPLLAIAKGER